MIISISTLLQVPYGYRAFARLRKLETLWPLVSYTHTHTHESLRFHSVNSNIYRVDVYAYDSLRQARKKSVMDFVSNEFQQSHEGSFFGKEKRKKKTICQGGFFWFVCFVGIYLRSVIEPLLNEREGWTRKSG